MQLFYSSLNVVLVPYMGIFGAAIATLISFTIASIITVRVSFRYLKFVEGGRERRSWVFEDYFQDLILYNLQSF